MESHRTLKYAQPPAENRPAWPWLNRERWIAAPGGIKPWGAGAGQALTTIYLGDGDILLETCLVGVGSFSTVMGCGVNRDLGYHWEPCGPVSRWWHLNDRWQGTETGLPLATLPATVTSTAQISTQPGLGRPARRCAVCYRFLSALPILPFIASCY